VVLVVRIVYARRAMLVVRESVLAVVALVLMTRAAAAQGTASVADHTIVAVTGTGLLSIQPADESYVGLPYLDRGLGGYGFGGGAAISVINHRRFMVAAEFSTTSISATQRGRLVGGRDINPPAEGRLHDTLIAALVGVVSESRRFQAQGGLGWFIGNPTLNGEDVTTYDSEHRRGAVGGGLDVTKSIASRAEIIAGGRYWFAPRSTHLEQIGVGPHIIRIGFGIRVRLR